MDSRLVIKQIKTLTAMIQQDPTDARIQPLVKSIADDVTNPYLLCFQQLLIVSNDSKVNITPIIKRIAELKNESSKNR